MKKKMQFLAFAVGPGRALAPRAPLSPLKSDKSAAPPIPPAQLVKN
jgi:hypothetical protein